MGTVCCLRYSKRTDALNRMWRNTCINDTYEPGSTFKIITASAGLEAGVVTLQDQFSCPGFRVVEDRRIHCARRTGHGAQTFVQGIENSCNPVFIDKIPIRPAGKLQHSGTAVLIFLPGHTPCSFSSMQRSAR